MNVANSKPVLIGLAAVIILLALTFPSLCPNAQAQDATTFTPSDRFSIPEFNGSISFALNGSYSSATLENGTWTFNDLRLNNSQPLGNLKISAENSIMTIWSFRSFNFSGRSAQLRYNIQGTGTQTINLCLNSTQQTHPSEWTVTVPGVPGSRPANIFLAEGDKWKLLPDNSVVVSGLTGNLSVTHYGYTVLDDRNLPFYQQHSIMIITATLLAVIAAVAVIIHYKVRR